MDWRKERCANVSVALALLVGAASFFVSYIALDHWIKRNPHWSIAVQKMEELKIREKVQAYDPETLRRKWAELLNQHFETFRVYSLSKRFDNMSLWAKYAANHT